MGAEIVRILLEEAFHFGIGSSGLTVLAQFLDRRQPHRWIATLFFKDRPWRGWRGLHCLRGLLVPGDGHWRRGFVRFDASLGGTRYCRVLREHTGLRHLG